MHLKGDDVPETLLLKATDNKQGVSPTPAEEAAFLGEDTVPQEAQETTTCPSNLLEETPKPEAGARLLDPQDAKELIPPPPPGFGLPA